MYDVLRRLLDFLVLALGGNEGNPGPLPMESKSVQQTALTYTDGLLTSYTEDGVVWTIARDADGNPTSTTHA